MSTTDDKAMDICGRQFRIVKKGLDVAEIASYIGDLIDQNNELAGKLTHIDSLKKLAEQTVIEADKHAASIAVEIEEEANAKAISIIAEAEDKAKAEGERIVAEAQEKAKAETERIIAQAQQSAEWSAQEKISLAEQQAQDIIKAAEEEAGSFKAHAEKEASTIIAEAKETAKSEMQHTQEEAERLRIVFRKRAEREIRENFERICQEFFPDSDDVEETTAVLTEDESKTPEPSESEAASGEEVDVISEAFQGQLTPVQEEENAESEADPDGQVMADEPQDELSLDQQEDDQGKSRTLYHGTVELAISPPIAFDRVLRVHKELKEIAQIEVVDFRGSIDEGIRIKLHLPTEVPLREMLASLPGVEKVSDLKKGSKAQRSQRSGDGPRVRKIAITMRK